MINLKIYKIAPGVFRHVIDDNPNTTFYNSAANNIIVKDNPAQEINPERGFLLFNR
jgi:hypothetical protein